MLAGTGMYYVYTSFNGLLESVAALSNPDDAYHLAEDIRKDLISTENSMRSYMMTGQLEYLDDYLEGMDRISKNLDSLPQLGLQVSRPSDLDEIALLLQTRADLMYDLVDLKHRQQEEGLADKTLVKVQDQLSSRDEVGSPIVVKKEISPDLKPLTLTTEVAETEKKKLRNLFNRNKETTIVLPEATSLQIESDSSITGSDIETYSINYSSDINIEEVRKILKGISAEERQYNARLNKQEMEILASDRLLMSKVNSIMDRIDQSSDAAIIQYTTTAKNKVASTSRNIFIISVVSLIAGMTLLTLLIIDINRMHTFRMQLEESKDYAEKLAQTRQEFLANMSHEIRTPLNAIIGFTEQLKHQQVDETTQHHTALIGQASEHLLEIVNDILDYSKLESGKVMLNKVPFAINDVLAEVNTLLQPRAVEKGLYYKTEEDAGIYQIIEGDPLRLKQVLINLISNAIKFTKNGGIQIEVNSRIRERFTDFIIKVTDTGIGIPEIALKKIFDDFSQADTSTSRSYGGTGLGLAISKKIIEQHGGIIDVESEPGAGSTFTIKLSYRNSTHTSTQIPSNDSIASYNLQGYTILVADDEPFNIQLADMILKRAGADVHVFEDGHSVEEAIVNKNFDCYLIDLHMPDKDGLALALSIRMKHPDARIIAVTADVVSSKELLLQNGHFNDILYKPYHENQLLSIVAEQSLDIPSLTNQPIIQTTSLYSLDEIKAFCGDDEEMLQDVIQTFLHSAPQQVDTLCKALDNGDINGIHEAAHKMLPSFHHFRINSLLELLRKLETCDEINTAERKNAKKTIEETCQRVFEELQQETNKLNI
jgi:signal transduction histidine kinase/ActR/RegA family two-component response regulator/HPt (histidine-containing phosphotransfer) domain-containing protein